MNGFSTAPIHLTPQEIALGNEKQQLAREYMTVLQGKEPLATYEQHMIAYMNKHHLGNTANLHNALTHSFATKAQALARTMAHGVTPDVCPNIAANGVAPQATCSTGEVQFPEEQGNWCGNAATSTILIENSFYWQGSATYIDNRGTFTLTYDSRYTSQPGNIATPDETMLAQNFFYNYGNYNGVDPAPLTTVLNDYVHGKGGNYVEWTNIGDFQNDMITDVNEGWDLADGISIQNVDPTASQLFGYPQHVSIAHWLPVTLYGNGGATTYYADPVYNSPDYSRSAGWVTNGPEATIATNSLTQYSFVFVW